MAFLDGELYAVIAGGGCGHGNPDHPNMVAKVDTTTGQWTMVADMSAAVVAHPAANVDPEDFQPDGDFYSLIAARGKLYTVEPNHGQVWSVTKKGDVEMVTDISKPEGHIVPTALVDSDGGLLVSNLGSFPITPDLSQLLTLRPGCGAGLGYAVEDCRPGTLHVAGSSMPGLTTVLSDGLGAGWAAVSLELSDPKRERRSFRRPAPARWYGCGRRGRGRNHRIVGADGDDVWAGWGAVCIKLGRSGAPIGQILRFNMH